MTYTIALDGGKYMVANDNGHLTFLRHGEPWPGADDLKHSGVVLAMAQRIEELETAISRVVDGPLMANGARLREETPSWLAAQGSPRAESVMIGWHNILKRALEQKP